MSNDVATIKSRPIGYYNQNKGEEVLPLSIRVKLIQTKDGKKFNKIEVYARYQKCYKFKDDVELKDYFDKDWKYIGAEDSLDSLLEESTTNGRWTQLSFLENAFDNVVDECCIKSPSKLTTGTLYVKSKGIDKKQVFKPYLKEGKLVYTKVWIKSDIVGFEARTASVEEFTFPTNETPSHEVIETVCDENGVVEVETPTEECSM